jgi:hypothetical protein
MIEKPGMIPEELVQTIAENSNMTVTQAANTLGQLAHTGLLERKPAPL